MMAKCGRLVAADVMKCCVELSPMPPQSPLASVVIEGDDVGELPSARNSFDQAVEAAEDEEDDDDEDDEED